jgi:hypothetical protein
MTEYNTSFTKPIKQFAKAVGSSFRSLFSGKTYFTLEHLTPSQRYNVGFLMQVSAHYIKLGRLNDCLVRYDYKPFDMVSREHAAIEYENGNWVLKHLSKTNPTLVNDILINKEYYLKSGDIIRLSYNGPKLKFLLPAKDSVKIDFSTRTGMVRKQLKMYNKILIPLIAVFFVIAAVLVYIVKDLSAEVREIKHSQQISQAKYDSIVNDNNDLLADPDLKNKLKDLKKKETDKRPIPPLVHKKSKTTQPADSLPASKPDTSKKTKQQVTPKPPQQQKDSVTKGNEKNNRIENFLIEELDNDILAFASDGNILIKSGKNQEQEKLENLKYEGIGFFVLSGKSKFFLTTRQMIAPWDYFDHQKAESFEYEFNKLIYSSNPKPAIEVQYKILKNEVKFKNLDFIISTKEDERFNTVNKNGINQLQQRGICLNNWAKTGLISTSTNAALLWDPSVLPEPNDTLYICALGSQGLIVDMCIFRSLENNRVNFQKCSDLLYKNGGPVIYLKKDNLKDKKIKIYVIGMVTGWPDESFILPLENFINK